MVNLPPPQPNARLAQLEATVRQLQETLRIMEEQRQQAIEKRRRRLLTWGGLASVVFHIALLIFLAPIHRGIAGAGDAEGESYDLALLSQEELTELEQTSFDEIETEAIEVESAVTETAALTATSPAAAELSAATGAAPTLGGAGAGGGGEVGMGGGGGGTTSFFGIGSKGTRFAFIIDRSGSMVEGGRLDIAKRELMRALDALPDYAYFYVLMFNTEFEQPPGQRNWLRARKPAVRQILNWLSLIDPTGGTSPRTSFMQVFSLETRPDVIYFLTDGNFQDITPDEIAALNRGGKRAVINTIQFGDRSGEELLRRIAKLTGGVYRFVSTEVGR